jgi:hypothetical protein
MPEADDSLRRSFSPELGQDPLWQESNISDVRHHPPLSAIA